MKIIVSFIGTITLFMTTIPQVAKTEWTIPVVFRAFELNG